MMRQVTRIKLSMTILKMSLTAVTHILIIVNHIPLNFVNNIVHD